MIIKTLKTILPSYNGKYHSDFQKLIKAFPEDYSINNNDIDILFKAFQIGLDAHKDQKRKSGEKYFNHCIEVAIQLIKWNMDLSTIISGLLHDTIEDTEISKEDLKQSFGEDIANLVERVSKLSGIKYRNIEHKQAENFMKMFLSISKDLRVIIIKFSDRLHNMRTIQYLPRNKQKRIAIETRDLYAPLAHRLGMNIIKMEFEDLCFKTLHKAAYEKIRNDVNATKKQREKYINKFIKPILPELKKYKINAEPYGRAKHYFSIYKKVINNDKIVGELYDLMAIRIVVIKIVGEGCLVKENKCLDCA